MVGALGLSVLMVFKREDLANWELKGTAVSSLARTLDGSVVAANDDIVEIDSSLGFNVAFDKDMFDVFAQTTDLKSTPSYVFGESFEDDELSETRDYSLVKLKVITQQESPDFMLTPELAVSTNIRDTFWETQRAKAGNGDKSKIDLLIGFLNESNSEDPSRISTDVSDVTIGSYTYKKIVTSTSNSQYGIDTPSTYVTYATIQNDRPYWSTIRYARQNSPEIVQFEAVIKDIIYPTPTSPTLTVADPTKETDESVSMTIASTGPFVLPERTSYVPNELDDETLVKVVARNQPAVVRVLTIRCADYTLSSGQSAVDYKDLCTYGIGSGSIITSDGYILTNGHVASIQHKDVLDYGILGSRDNIEDLLEYLVSSGDLSEGESQNLLDGLTSRSADAIDALMNITDLIDDNEIKAQNDDYTYAIQLSTTPMRVNAPQRNARIEPNFGDTITEAKFIDMNFDQTSIAALDRTGVAGASDVAILKMEGTYPAVKLGSIDDVKYGNRLTAIGYPAFVDGGITTKQTKTVPSITQGKVKSVFDDGSTNRYQLVGTTVPIAQGNSGGPSFNDSGLQVGVNTYGYFKCADLNCFGDGVVRDIADAKQLLIKNNITVNDSASLTRDWYSALDNYELGNYKDAISELKQVEKEYPANYLVKPLMASAESALGSETDRSNEYEQVDTVQIVVWVLGIGGGVLLVVGVILILQARRLSHQTTPQGAVAESTPPNTPPNAV